MTIQCPTCSKINPANATYCYYDGRSLSQVTEAAPWWIGTLGFPTPFTFPDGQICANFDQLAVACDSHWNESRRFLDDGIWCSFFTKLGRHDLAAAAVQATKEVDRDIGLAYFLERLPTEALRRPTLSLLSKTEDLGTLEAGKDQKFEVVISNKGSLVLSGNVVTDCEWLFFGDRQGNVSRKLFQTRDNYTLSVRVIGNKLRAGRTPLEGQIAIETNGGSMTVLVKAVVPILPLPRGSYANNVLAGARTPREIALKAKAHPQEAAALFEQGAVNAWYESNGWTYPVQGTQGKGKAAVQQYFEALGLTKPPLLEMDTQRIVCQGKVGQRLTRNVTISTQEAKFVNADAYADQTWIKVQPSTSQGNRVTIPLLIEVPPSPNGSLHANIMVQGNGQQRFVVPVTLAVAAAAAPVTPAKDEEDDDDSGSGSRQRWILAGVGGVLVCCLAVGSMLLFANRKRPVAAIQPIVDTTPQPPPVLPPVAKVEAWWDGIPNQKLAASAQELRATVAADTQSIFEAISAKSDTARYKTYEQLSAKLPGLMRDAKSREPLARFLADCCVHEPSDLNISHLTRALAGQFPKAGDLFVPEEKGGELEHALYSRQILFSAMNNKAVKPDRARSLASEIASVLGASINSSAPPDKVELDTEKALAMRCYRNTRPTATKSLDHALAMRSSLIEKFPKHLPRAFRDEFDADLLGIGLAKGDVETWTKLKPMFETCLSSEDTSVAPKLIGAYSKANAEVAKQMEVLLAPKWKVAGNPKLTQADKAIAMLKIVNSDPGKIKLAMADRLAQLQKLTDKTLSAGKPAPKTEAAHLMHTMRLAHSSTLGSILFHKEAEIERFDELVTRVPDAKPGAPEEAKAPDPKPKQPAEGDANVIDLEGQNYSVTDSLTKANDRDPSKGGFRTKYSVSLRAGQRYTVDMKSTEFNPLVRLLNSAGREVSAKGGSLSARTYQPTADGTYSVIATTAVKGATGSYSLQIQKEGGRGMGNIGGIGGIGGIGIPPPPFRGLRPRFVPGVPFIPFMPEQPKAAPAKVVAEDSQVSKSDLAGLTNTQANSRVIAFNNLVGNLPNDLKPQPAEKIAVYLLVTIATDGELEEVSGKLDSLANCRHLVAAIADLVGNNDKVTQPRTEAVVGGILGQRLRFAKDEDWRSATRKLLLHQALGLTVVSANAATADSAADYLRDLYKEQGLAFGLETEEFLAQTQATRVLEGVIKHVAAKVLKKDPPSAEKEYLEQLDRHLQVARFAAENDLEHMVSLQRIWLRVLSAYLQHLVPTQANGMLRIQQELAVYDRDARNVFDQLRVAEEKLLRVWALANSLKGS